MTQLAGLGDAQNEQHTPSSSDEPTLMLENAFRKAITDYEKLDTRNEDTAFGELLLQPKAYARSSQLSLGSEDREPIPDEAHRLFIDLKSPRYERSNWTPLDAVANRSTRDLTGGRKPLYRVPWWTIVSLTLGALLLGTTLGIGWTNLYVIDFWTLAFFLVAGAGLWLVAISAVIEGRRKASKARGKKL